MEHPKYKIYLFCCPSGDYGVMVSQFVGLWRFLLSSCYLGARRSVHPSDLSSRHSRPAATLLHNNQLWCGTVWCEPSGPYAALSPLLSYCNIRSSDGSVYAFDGLPFISRLSYPGEKKSPNIHCPNYNRGNTITVPLPETHPDRALCQQTVLHAN